MKRFIPLLSSLSLLATIEACSPEIEALPPDDNKPEVENPSNDDNNTSTGNDNGSNNDDNNENNVVDRPLRPEPNYDIEAWSGIWADDEALDMVGEDADFYHENNTFTNLVVVRYDATTATVISSNDKVVSYIDGAHVAIDLTKNSLTNIEILLIGSSSDGSLKVYSENKYKLSLYGVELTSQRGPAINSQSKKRVFVDLVAGTTNRLTDCSSYGEDVYTPAGVFNEDRKGAFFAEGNIIVSGSGALVVNGNYNHAIVTDGCYYQRAGATIVVESAVKNAIHVKGDSDDGTGVYIAGGALHIRVAGTAGKGIKSDMDIVVAGGRLDIATTGDAYYDSTEGDTSSAAALKADGSIRIEGGELALCSTGSGGKGINADTDIYIEGGTTSISTSGGRYTYTSSLTSSPKGIKADGDIAISGGTLLVSVTGRSEGSEGIESKSTITISGGETIIEAYDDAINAASTLTINSGRLYAYSSNNDGIDCNGQLIVNDGLVIGVGSNAPEAGIDVDNSNNFKIHGGVAIGYGAALQSTPSTQSQQCSVSYGGISASMGQKLAVLNSASLPIVTFEVPRQLNGANFFFSTPDIMQGSSYTIQSSGAITDYTDSWQGWYLGGVWSSGTTLTTFTSSGIVTSIGSQGEGPGDPGGGGGGGRPR